MGLHQAVALCMDHCHCAELAGDPDWFKTVVLSGGTACLPGLAGKCPLQCPFLRAYQYDRNRIQVLKNLR